MCTGRSAPLHVLTVDQMNHDVCPDALLPVHTRCGSCSTSPLQLIANAGVKTMTLLQAHSCPFPTSRIFLALNVSTSLPSNWELSSPMLYDIFSLIWLLQQTVPCQSDCNTEHGSKNHAYMCSFAVPAHFELVMC